MVCGTPVMASCAAAIPEVVGDSALLVDPASPASIAHGIARVLSDARLAEELVGRGRARAASHLGAYGRGDAAVGSCGPGAVVHGPGLYGTSPARRAPAAGVPSASRRSVSIVPRDQNAPAVLRSVPRSDAALLASPWSAWSLSLRRAPPSRRAPEPGPRASRRWRQRGGPTSCTMRFSVSRGRSTSPAHT